MACEGVNGGGHHTRKWLATGVRSAWNDGWRVDTAAVSMVRCGALATVCSGEETRRLDGRHACCMVAAAAGLRM